MKLWDSIESKTKTNDPAKSNRQKSKSHFTPERMEPLKNQEAKTRISTLWDASGLDYTTIIEIAEPLARRRGSALDR